jgi:hypothetical protein
VKELWQSTLVREWKVQNDDVCVAWPLLSVH